MPETLHSTAARPVFDLIWAMPKITMPRQAWPARRLPLHPAPAIALTEAIIAEIPDCIEVVDQLGRLLFINAAGIAMFGLESAASVVGMPWINNWVFDGETEASAAVAAVVSGEIAQFDGFRLVATGVVACHSVSVSPMSGARCLVISREIGAERQALLRQRLVNNELQHRIKNTLAIVQSLVSQTLCDGIAVDAARRIIADRLSALARATDMLTQADWQPVPFTSVVMDAVAFMNVAPGRVVIDGPAVVVGPKSAFMLTMALHELSTNAAKYGALSIPGGHVELSWWTVREAGEERVRLSWTERDGPPVSAPTHEGFGARLIGRVTERQLQGKVRIAFDPAGLVWTLDTAVRTLAT